MSTDGWRDTRGGAAACDAIRSWDRMSVQDIRDARDTLTRFLGESAVRPGERAFSAEAVTSSDDDTVATQSGVSRALDAPGEVDVDAVMQVIAIYVGKPLEPWQERAVRLVLARDAGAS